VAYKRPSDDVARLLGAAPTPVTIPSYDRSRLALVEHESNPPLTLLARPYLRLAGVRVDPGTGGLRRTGRIAAIRVLDVAGGEEVGIALPDGSFGLPTWSPDGRRLALTRHRDGGKEVWVADALDGSMRRIEGLLVADTLGSVQRSGQPVSRLRWTAEGMLLTTALVSSRLEPAPEVPPSPREEESSGKRSQMATFQDLLTDDADDARFEHYAIAQLVRVDPDSGAVERLGEPGMIHRFEPSPDGHHLLVERIRPPFSHRVPWELFARTAEVWDRDGVLLRVLADLPVADEVPRHGVPAGARSVEWQASVPSTLVWAEALDGGDPTVRASHRDRLMRWRAPFEAEPEEVMRIEHRLTELDWLAEGERVLLSEWDRDRRWRRTWLLALDAPDSGRLLFDLSVNDAYADPGTPLGRRLVSGHRVVHEEDGSILLAGEGASPEGERPFLDRLDLASGERTRVFRSPADAHEHVVAVREALDDGIVIQRQTRTEPPNLVLAGPGERRRQLTHHADPHPRLSGAEKRILRYRRDDGVPLSGLLELPPGWKPGDARLPVLLWAYPVDYADPDTAGQVRGSERMFTRLEGASPLWLLLRGWAVFTAAMPVVGDPEKMNDTFVEQVVASARAAIDTLDAEGVADRGRMVASGHSYGGFMTATLLAHSELFAAGIARSGAYNRSLTPFGFQTERRSYWEAPEVYHRVSPFAHADRIRRPLLLIHGADDSNSGTYTIQSERLFQAIQGTGGTARLVLLPHEDHGYRAQESILHVIEETFEWVGRHAGAGETVASAAP
jgi:dipeptidyl aminopeptidase/acylaminoacyl peptidase